MQKAFAGVMSCRSARGGLAGLWLFCLAACATPAVQVKVPVMTVSEAWTGAARASLPADEGPVDARLSSAADPSPAPVPVLSAPDIRMAYIKPWTDAEGNRHFGTWVALQVRAARWVLPDGSIESFDAGAGAAAPFSRPEAPSPSKVAR